MLAYKPVIPGILSGHASDYEALTGCTVLICEAGMVAGVDVGGASTGTQELETLSPQHRTPAIHALMLGGGSAFGLEAACGARNFLEQRGVGFATPYGRVPIVPSAILYDLGIGRADVRPTREMGVLACRSAKPGPPAQGCVGAGVGATLGKVLGLKHAMKGGLGYALSEMQGINKGVLVSAMAVVNAFGDVLDPGNGRIVAGARRTPGRMDFLNTNAELAKKGWEAGQGGNTTLAVVATNARLTKVEATQLAREAQAGLLRSIVPAHTLLDGDLVFALSHGNEKADRVALGAMAGEVLSRAILNAVQKAWSLGGVPGLAKQP
jgi:L-aminopeptidase/D-esterase-like protein